MQLPHLPRHAHGEAHPKARLTNRRVRSIRREYLAGESVNALAHRYSVSWKTVRRVLDGTTWKHVK